MNIVYRRKTKNRKKKKTFYLCLNSFFKLLHFEINSDGIFTCGNYNKNYKMKSGLTSHANKVHSNVTSANQQITLPILPKFFKEAQKRFLVIPVIWHISLTRYQLLFRITNISNLLIIYKSYKLYYFFWIKARGIKLSSSGLLLRKQVFPAWIRPLAICRGELSAVISQLTFRCSWSSWTL